MLFGSDVDRKLFTRSDGAPAGYTYRTLMGDGQWVGAVGLHGALYRIMLTGDASEASMSQLGEGIIKSLRVEPKTDTDPDSRPQEAFRGKLFKPDSGEWYFTYPEDMTTAHAPSNHKLERMR